MPQSIDYYKQQAGNQLSAEYAQQLQNLQNQYNQSAQQTKDTGKQTQNNYNNQVLARGLGRSSIATTGLSGIENSTNKNLTNLTTNYNQGVAGINANRDSSIAKLAQDLYNTDYNREWQQQQADEAKRRWEAEMAEQKRQFDAQQALALQQLRAQQAAAAAKASSATTRSGESLSRDDIDRVVNNNSYSTYDKARALYGLLNDLGSGNSSMKNYIQNILNTFETQNRNEVANKSYVSNNAPEYGSARRISGNSVY